MAYDYLKDLNEAQRAAVEYLDGPMMIIAGAGSGKTRALTYKIAYLIDSGLDPFRILALTFTNKAAREMKDRVLQLLGNTDAGNIWMGTFHSVCARLLRIYGSYLGYPPNFTIYDNDDSKGLLRTLVKEMNLDPKVYTASSLLHRISSAKTNLITPAEYAATTDFVQEDRKAHKPYFSEIFSRYNQRLHKAAAMDFDDLLFNMNVLLRDEPDVLYRLQQKFSYILVDEYQDTNYSQYLIVKKLAAQHESLCVVGDDAQSIYGFRGANIENILQLKNDYQELKLFKMEQNYRSTKTIVNAANSVISHNKDQIEKVIWTDNEEGCLLKLIKAGTDNEEGTLVANSIFETKMNQQLPHTSFAVLYRTNAQSRPLEEALRRLNIPYRIYGGLSFYQRKEVKDLLAYFRLVVNPLDEEALMRVINYPARGIGKTTMDRVVVLANENGLSVWDMLCRTGDMVREFNSGTRARIGEFVTLIRSFQTRLLKKDAFDLGRDIAAGAGLLKLLSEDKTPEGVSRYQNIEELLNGLREFTDTERPVEEENPLPFRTLDEYMQSVSLLTDLDTDDKEQTDRVTLMTIHSAKGLEFPYVYIVGLEENLFPSYLSMGSRQELEEERRLFYVALTRAEKQAVLSFARSRLRWGNFTFCEPSRFLAEIDPRFIEKPQGSRTRPDKAEDAAIPYASRPDLSKMKKVTPNTTGKAASDASQLAVGMRVKHERFGAGIIREIEGNPADLKATVLFDLAGEKKLLLRFARLDPID
ncbi:MAG TPA: 3'-5' exonuclease [Bacteroidales bacterium]|nr:3'-5' exonuclease [Bacteroidales bacterium]